jgi:hypothetical protein
MVDDRHVAAAQALREQLRAPSQPCATAPQARLRGSGSGLGDRLCSGHRPERIGQLADVGRD